MQMGGRTRAVCVFEVSRQGPGMAKSKVRLSQGLWGWKEEQTLLKKCCDSEYAAAMLYYQCMSSPTATLHSLVGYAFAWVALCVHVCYTHLYDVIRFI